MKLLFFGKLRDVAESASFERDIPADITDSEALRRWLGDNIPDLMHPGVSIALDDLIVRGAAPLAGVSEVAFLPPVSGG